ncbi:MAG: hypothetical protein GY745_18340, partial [Actinomycetia bacterium]|nr:hypothetical protein [Actinomycetes bacterium]
VSGSYSINTTSTAIDSVIKGVRYIDLIKQSVKSINGMSVTAPKFDIGGEFYDQIASNGNLIRQFDDEPFYVTYKDRKENLMEVHANIQVNNDHIFVGQYDDFYANVDNGGFLSLPSSKFKTWLNERYAINGIDFGYKNYEKDKDEENTRDAVHTESQWSVPNDQVQNTKSIKIGDIRDPFLIESQRKLALKETTSTSTDNKIFVLDIVLLSPSKRGEYSVPLRHNANDDGNLQLLNDATYNWNLLGFQVGDEFILVDTDNADTYSVDEITNNVITLIPTTITPTSLDDIVITEINYPYTNVAYTNR